MRFKEFITEMAMQTGEGLALVQYGNGLLVVFKPNPEFKKATFNMDFEKMQETNAILGIIQLRDNTLYKSMEVNAVWAVKGYGPLMYMLAMSSAQDYGLMPSRMNGQISPEAQNVWKNFYDGQGKKFVNYRKTKANHHQEDFLNKRYKIKNPHPNYEQMIQKGKIFFNNNQNAYEHFIEFADYILKSKMNKIYGDGEY